MQQIFDTVVDRTRSRLDVPKIRTIFGTAQRPRRTRTNSSMIEAAIETPTFDLTVFKLHFGRLTGKAYTKGERVLRFEAVVHNTAELRCGRMIDKFPEIVTRLAGLNRSSPPRNAPLEVSWRRARSTGYWNTLSRR